MKSPRGLPISMAVSRVELNLHLENLTQNVGDLRGLLP